MQDVVSFFDDLAARWDNLIKAEDAPVIRQILNRAEIGTHDRVLDVGCGTGVLMPYYFERGLTPQDLLAIDIAPGMVARFKEKFPEVSVMAGDFQTPLFDPCSVTKVMIYNTFPHFDRPAAVFERAAAVLKPGGSLIIAHSMNRAALDKHHENSQGVVASHRLMSDEEFRSHFRLQGFVDSIVEDSDHFFARGVLP